MANAAGSTDPEAGALDVGAVIRDYPSIRSTIVAIPWPTPMHIEASP
jgi:hypothetical protein